MRGISAVGRTILPETWRMEDEKRMRLLVIENRMTRNDHSASTFPGHPRCSSRPSCWVSMWRGVHFGASLHLLSELAARGKPAPKTITLYPLWDDDSIWNMPGQPGAKKRQGTSKVRSRPGEERN